MGTRTSTIRSASRAVCMGAACIGTMCPAFALAQAPVQEISTPYRAAQVDLVTSPLPVARYVAPAAVQIAAPAAPAAPAASAAPAALPRWQVQIADMTLSRTLERWAGEAGVRLRWDAARTFAIHAPTVFVGEFETAVAALLSTPGVRDSDYPLEACLYANTPPLLRVTRRGEQAAACEPVGSPATQTVRKR